MTLHPSILQQADLPQGVTDAAGLRAYYRRLQAKRYDSLSRPVVRRLCRPEPSPEPPDPLPEDEPLYTDLVQDQPAIVACFPTNTLIKIMQAVIRASGVSHVDIVSMRRTSEVIRPRHTFFYLARTRSTYSLPTIGRMVGGRDHTTILHGYRKVSYVLDANRIAIPDDIDLESAARLILNADWRRK